MDVAIKNATLLQRYLLEKWFQPISLNKWYINIICTL